MKMIDCLGQPIFPGDFVVYPSTTNGALELEVAVVLTTKMKGDENKIKLIATSRKSAYRNYTIRNQVHRFPDTICKVENIPLKLRNKLNEVFQIYVKP